jgi:hypothetical protein
MPCAAAAEDTEVAGAEWGGEANMGTGKRNNTDHSNKNVVCFKKG